MTSPSDPPAPVDGANGGIQPGRYYSRGIPYLPIDGYPGKLIAVEGTDGVGRSTQIQLLREYGSMGEEFHFRVVDARRSVVQIQDELRRQVAAFLEPVSSYPTTPGKPSALRTYASCPT